MSVRSGAPGALAQGRAATRWVMPAADSVRAGMATRRRWLATGDAARDSGSGAGSASASTIQVSCMQGRSGCRTQLPGAG